MGVHNPVDAVPVVDMLRPRLNSIAAGTVTVTAKQMVNAVLVIASGTSSSLTTDTAANIIADLHGAQTFEFTLINKGSGTATLSAGSNVTLHPATAAGSTATVSFHVFKGVVTSSTTVDLYETTVATAYA